MVLTSILRRSVEASQVGRLKLTAAVMLALVASSTAGRASEPLGPVVA